MAFSQNLGRVDALEIEKELLLYLEDHIYSGSQALKKIQILLRGAGLTPAELSGSITKLFSALKQRGIVSIGNYKRLKDPLRSVDVTVVRQIEDYEKQIMEVLEGRLECDGINSAGDNKQQTQNLEPDLELIFDFLSRKLPPAETSLFEASLLNETQLAETANMHRNPANTYFKIMYTWKCRNPSINHIKKLREKLSEMQRQDLLDDMDDFKITNYKYSNVIGSGSCLITNDFMTIATHLATDYLHLVRFLGLPHRTIEHIETDHHTVKEQIFQCLVQLKRSKPSVTRQDLCDGLVYVDHQEVAAILNDKWGKEMSV